MPESRSRRVPAIFQRLASKVNLTDGLGFTRRVRSFLPSPAIETLGNTDGCVDAEEGSAFGMLPLIYFTTELRKKAKLCTRAAREVAFSFPIERFEGRVFEQPFGFPEIAIDFPATSPSPTSIVYALDHSNYSPLPRPNDALFHGGVRSRTIITVAIVHGRSINELNYPTLLNTRRWLADTVVSFPSVATLSPLSSFFFRRRGSRYFYYRDPVR